MLKSKRILLRHETDAHQAIPAIKFQTESVRPIADEQRFGLLPRFLAAHSVGITDAVVAGHQAVGNGIGVGRDALRVSVFGRIGGHTRCVHTTDFMVILMIFN